MQRIDVQPARKERLADVIYGQILDQILSGQFEEGDKLPTEAQLSFAFGVSRPVVREALMRLQADGLIHAHRGIGSFVSNKPSNRLSELASSADVAGYLRSFEPRIVLEVDAARLSALRRTRAQLDEIKDSIEALRAAIAKGDLGQPEDLRFHDCVAAAAGNDYYPRLLKDLRRSVTRTMTIGLELSRNGSTERRHRVIEEHTKVYEAVAAQDAECAAAYMRYHLYQARAAVIDMHHHERGAIKPFANP